MVLHVLRGISASGKTTLAKTLDAVRISRDDIRADLTGQGTKFAGDNAFENKVTKIQTEMVRELLIDRKDVVIDDTNLPDKYVQRWLDMAQDYGHGYAVHRVEVQLETALERNANRPYIEAIPEDVIRKQYSRVPHNPVDGVTMFNTVYPTHPFVDWSPYVPDTLLPPAVGVDLDGTLALLANGYGVYDPAHYPHDRLNEMVNKVIYNLWLNEHYVLVLTGRDEAYRDVVEKWLHSKGVTYDYLLMRPKGDNRRDDVVKAELFNKYIRNDYNFKLQLDDRQRVIRMFRSRGIPAWAVNDGNF